MTVVVSSERGQSWLAEVYQYREFLFNLVKRDLKVRYRNSVLGFVWSLLNPLLMMTVFSIVFSVLTIHENEIYPVFILVALLPWNYTASSVMGAVNAIAGNGHLIKRVYFPREILPSSMVISNLVNFLLALPVLFVIKIALSSPFSWYILYLPVIILLQTIFLLGVAYFLSSVNVYFRDTEVIVDVFILAWFFLSPVVYNMEQLAPQFANVLYWINPMASLLSSYRLILYNNAPPDPLFMFRTTLTCLLTFVVGYLVFRRLAPNFGEEV
jgi:ABC-type polysaccharide/polyol phosphate export permease